jgi:hypothetical protein
LAERAPIPRPIQGVLDLSGNGLPVDDELACCRNDAGGMAFVFKTDSDFAEHPREAMSSLDAGGRVRTKTPSGPTANTPDSSSPITGRAFAANADRHLFWIFFGIFFGSREMHETDDST